MDSLLDEDRDVLEQIAAAREADTIRMALEAARERLAMDAAYLNHLDERRQLIEEVAGETAKLGFDRGAELPLDDTYCSLMLAGKIPNLVQDTRSVPEIQDIPATKTVGAYVGVPVTLSDGTVHGTLCCASGESRQDLGDAELAFLKVLAGMVAARIERSRSSPP